MYVRVAELRSFTEAARELHIAQSAVSRTIQELERQVGSSLLLRRGRTVELTPAGAELLPIARRLLNVYRTSMEDFGRFLAGEGGRVAVAALPSVAAAMLPTAIASFLLAHPRVHIDIQDGHLENVVRDTLSGRADFGITASVRLPRGVDARDLVSDRFAGLLPRNHPLCRRRSVTWKDLSCEPFIALSRDTGVRAVHRSRLRPDRCHCRYVRGVLEPGYCSWTGRRRPRCLGAPSAGPPCYRPCWARESASRGPHR